MKHFLLYIFLLFLVGCKYELPEALITRSCANSMAIMYSVDAANPLKYNFTASNNSIINYPITWQTNTGLVLGTSSTNSFSYTFASNGSYNIKASFVNSCGDIISTNSGVFSVNKACNKPSGISILSSTNGRYLFKLDGLTSDILSVAWKTTNSSGGIVNQITNTNLNNFETSISTSGSYTTTTEITTTCGDKIIYNISYTFTAPLSNLKDIYICGYEGNVATYWKNGVAFGLTNGNYHSAAYSIQVVGNDIFVAGYENNGSVNVAKYWKNGIGVSLTNGTKGAEAVSISVVGNDIYVAGYEFIGSKLSVKYWKNGVVTNLTNGSNYEISNSITVNENNVYVSGHDNTNNVGKYWKNGEEIKVGSNIQDIDFVGKDIYLTGRDTNNNAAYWINGNITILTNGSDAYDLALDNNNLYILGRGKSNGLKYWKNGNENILEKISNTIDFAHSIFIIDSEVFISGYSYTDSNNKIAYYWKNGNAIKLSNNSNSAAFSIFITSK